MKTKLFRLFLSTAALLLANTLVAPCRVLGAEVSLNPTADAFVTTGPTNSLAANNYGGAGSLAVSAVGSSKGEFQSVLKFDTSAAKSSFDSLYGPGLWSLESLTLQLTAASPNNALFNANSAGLFGVSWMKNDSWTEGAGTPNTPTTTGITYNSLQSTFLNPLVDEVLGTFSYNGSSGGTFVYTLNLSPALVSDFLAGEDLSLRLYAADDVVSSFSDSRSFGTVASRPSLTITAVPEAGAATLLVLGGSLCLVRAASRYRR